jgi:capsule biosynthesis phosphatase
MKKTICFDIDNVICKTDKKKNYKKSKPIINNIKTINLLYEKGYNIVIFTARYMGRCNGDINLILKKIKPLTVLQLKKWGVKYHKLYFGKPSYDIFIDDKAIFFKKNWSTILKKKYLNFK